jgi:two-component system, NtrC family, response regulator PilR
MTTLDQTYTVLVVDDEADLRTLYQTALQRAGYTVVCADSVAQAIACLQAHADIACVVTDYRLPDATGIDLAQHIAQAYTGLPVAMMTAYGSPDHAVQALKAGAFDYLSKPVSIADLRSIVAQMLAQNHLRQCKDPAALLAQLAQLLPGQSIAMQRVYQVMAACSHTQACVAIDGEPGTGKELVARAIHSASVRSSQPFIVLNCETHRGDGLTSKEALYLALQAAQGGSLLLEKINALPQEAQLELLQVLQDRSFKLKANDKTTPVDVRLMVSSEMSLSQALSTGKLRQDLFYRLSVLTVSLPPLHERGGDAAWLAQRWLAQHPQGKAMTLSTAAIDALNTHHFAGNVRELENVLERSVALCTGRSSTMLEISFLNSVSSSKDTSTVDAVDPTSAQSTTPTDAVKSPIIFPLDLTMHLTAIERDIIEQALQHCRYNRTQAAGLLGLNLRQLRYRMEQLGIND